jgi:hypothetical protein
MVGGFNHNFRYKGRLFHVQTEDSGTKNPQIVTLLYEGGTILASSKVSYADQLEAGNLRQLVEQRMKSQHKQMLRRLRDGELDSKLGISAASPATADGSDACPDPGAGEPEPVHETALADDAVPDAVMPEEGLEKQVFAYLAGNDARYRM